MKFLYSIMIVQLVFALPLSNKCHCQVKENVQDGSFVLTLEDIIEILKHYLKLKYDRSGKMRVDDIQALDLAYAPPFSPVWDPILIAANIARKKCK